MNERMHDRLTAEMFEAVNHNACVREFFGVRIARAKHEAQESRRAADERREDRVSRILSKAVMESRIAAVVSVIVMVAYLLLAVNGGV